MATSRIRIEVDYKDSVARVGELEMTFKQLEHSATKSRAAIKKAVRDSEKSIAGTVKALSRERAALKETQSTLARNNEEYRRYQVQIDAVQKQMDRLTDTRRREEKTLKNSANGLKKQIELIRQEMNNRKLSNKQYRLMQEEIDRLEQRHSSLTNTVKAGTIAAYEEAIRKEEKYQREIATTSKEMEEAEQRIVSYRNKIGELAKGTRTASKAQEGMSSSAGAAGATVTEFGRTIGDAPFGLMGMANNLQQLSQQFVDLQAKSGGTKQAIQSIIQTMMGPAGFVVAINIVTSLLVAYRMRKKEATEQTEAFSNALILQSNILKGLRSDFLDGNESMEQRVRILETLALTDKNLQEIMKDSSLTEEERIKKAEAYVEQIQLVEDAESELAEARKQFEEDGRSIDEIRAEKQKLEKEQSLLRIQAATSMNVADKLGAQLEIGIRDQQILKLDELINKYDFIKSQTLEISNLRKNTEIEETTSEEEKQNAIQGTINFITDQISKIKEQRDATATTNEEVQKFNDQIAKLEFQLKALTEGRPYKIDLEFGTEGVATGFTGVSPIDNLTEQLQESFRKSGNDSGEQWADAFFKALDKGTEMEAFAAKAEILKERLSVINDVFQSQFDKRLTEEKNKTTALNDELKKRLSTEELSAEQRDKINQQIAQNDAKLVEEQNKIGKKQFQIEKAFKIVTAIADIPSMMSKAYLSQLTIPSPDAPARAKVAAKIAAGFGLAQVAALTSMKYENKAMPTPKLSAVGGGAAAESSSPSFNVVGGSNTNQIAEAVRVGLEATPIKTYVVSSDVTTAQEMDRKIVEGASI